MTDEPIFGNDDLIQSLRKSLATREHSVKAFPGLLRRTIETGAWRAFKTPLGELVTHQHFAAFLTSEPFNGLGISVDYAEQIVRHDKAVLEQLTHALQDGRQGRRTDLVDNIHEVERPTGTSETAALRRLRKDRPDLLEKVIARELSAHAAAVAAGFRPRTITIRADNPTSIAATLRRLLDPRVLEALIKELGDT